MSPPRTPGGSGGDNKEEKKEVLQPESSGTAIGKIEANFKSLWTETKYNEALQNLFEKTDNQDDIRRILSHNLPEYKDFFYSPDSETFRSSLVQPYKLNYSNTIHLITNLIEMLIARNNSHYVSHPLDVSENHENQIYNLQVLRKRIILASKKYKHPEENKTDSFTQEKVQEYKNKIAKTDNSLSQIIHLLYLEIRDKTEKEEIVLILNSFNQALDEELISKNAKEIRQVVRNWTLYFMKQPDLKQFKKEFQREVRRYVFSDDIEKAETDNDVLKIFNSAVSITTSNTDILLHFTCAIQRLKYLKTPGENINTIDCLSHFLIFERARFAMSIKLKKRLESYSAFGDRAAGSALSISALSISALSAQEEIKKRISAIHTDFQYLISESNSTFNTLDSTENEQDFIEKLITLISKKKSERMIYNDLVIAKKYLKRQHDDTGIPLIGGIITHLESFETEYLKQSVSATLPSQKTTNKETLISQLTTEKNRVSYEILHHKWYDQLEEIISDLGKQLTSAPQDITLQTKINFLSEVLKKLQGMLGSKYGIKPEKPDKIFNQLCKTLFELKINECWNTSSKTQGVLLEMHSDLSQRLSILEKEEKKKESSTPKLTANPNSITFDLAVLSKPELKGNEIIKKACLDILKNTDFPKKGKDKDEKEIDSKSPQEQAIQKATEGFYSVESKELKTHEVWYEAIIKSIALLNQSAQWQTGFLSIFSKNNPVQNSLTKIHSMLLLYYPDLRATYSATVSLDPGAITAYLKSIKPASSLQDKPS